MRREAYINYSATLTELEQRYQKTNEPKIYKQIKDTKMKITELLLDEYGKKNTYLKQNYYEAPERQNSQQSVSENNKQ